MAKRKRNRAEAPVVPGKAKPKRGEEFLNKRYKPHCFSLSQRKFRKFEEEMYSGDASEETIAIFEDHLGCNFDYLLDFYSGKTEEEEEAESLLRTITDINQTEEVRELCQNALALNPSSYEAYAALGGSYDSYLDGIVHYVKGLELGKEEFMEEPGAHIPALWTHLKGRTFLRLLDSLSLYQIRHSKYDEAIETCELMLILNARDHHGARQRLAMLYILQQKREKAEELLKEYPDDYLLGSEVSKLTLLIIDEEEKMPAEQKAIFEDLEIDDKDAIIKTYFPKSLEKLKMIHSRNPFCLFAATSPGVLMLPEPKIVHYQCCDEALELGQIFLPLWLELLSPFKLCAFAKLSPSKKLSKSDRILLSEILDANEEIYDDPEQFS